METTLVASLLAARSREREAKAARLALVRNRKARQADQLAAEATRSRLMGVARALRGFAATPEGAQALHAPFAATASSTSSSSSSSASAVGAGAGAGGGGGGGYALSPAPASLNLPDIAEDLYRGGARPRDNSALARQASMAPPPASAQQGVEVVYTADELAEMLRLMQLRRVSRVVLAGSPQHLTPYAGAPSGRPPRAAPPRRFKEQALAITLAMHVALAHADADTAHGAARVARGEAPVTAPEIAAAAKHAGRSLLDFIAVGDDEGSDYTDASADDDSDRSWEEDMEGDDEDDEASEGEDEGDDDDDDDESGGAAGGGSGGGGGGGGGSGGGGGRGSPQALRLVDPCVPQTGA